MSVIARFSDIMKSNINALLDKCEDPAKMIDQTLRNLNEDLSEVKKETASIMANEKMAKRKLDECQDEINKMDGYARKALQTGNENDAREFLSRKTALSSSLTSLQSTYDVSHANAQKMIQMHDKLVKDINELELRKDSIKAKIATAKAQQRMNKMTSNVDASSSISAFERMEAKADKMLDSANAVSELNVGSGDKVKDLAEKYNSGEAAVDDELAKLKAEMGL